MTEPVIISMLHHHIPSAGKLVFYDARPALRRAYVTYLTFTFVSVRKSEDAREM